MAGTRLLMQFTFVVEFFILALVALFFGLYKTKDPLTFHLPIYQGGRSRIRQSLQRLEDKSDLPIPVLRLATISAWEENLKDFIQQRRESVSLEWIIKENDNPCQNAANNNYDVEEDDADIWLCPPQTFPEEARNAGKDILVRNGGGTTTTSYIYALETSAWEHFLDQMLSYPSTEITSPVYTPRKPLKIMLVMEHRPDDWRVWAEALDIWLETNTASLQLWPCLQGPIQTEIVVSPLKSQVKDKDGNSSVRLLPANQIKESLLRKDRQANAIWNVILYVPKTTPAMFTDETGNLQTNAMLFDNALVSTVSVPEKRVVTQVIQMGGENENETDVTIEETEIITPVQQLVQDAMSPVNDFLLTQCLEISREQKDLIRNALSDDSNEILVANWQVDLWLQQALKTAYRHVQKLIREEGTWFLQSSTWVVIDEAVAEQWDQLVMAIEEAQRIAAEEKYFDALSLLEETLERVVILRTDPKLMEPLRFSPPQFLAIFAPLLLPLFLPHIIGLIREWKRYKSLRDKSAKAR